MIFTSSRHADPGHDITHRDNAVTQQSLSREGFIWAARIAGVIAGADQYLEG